MKNTTIETIAQAKPLINRIIFTIVYTKRLTYKLKNIKTASFALSSKQRAKEF